MKKESVRLGKNLKKYRTKRGMTQGDIVRAIGATRSFISNLESGKSNPTLFTIAKLAKVLDVPIHKLLK